MVDVSVIIPVHNADKWLDECLHSVWIQEFHGSFEISIFDDASQDNSATVIQNWIDQFALKNIRVVLGENNTVYPKGVGFAKNSAVEQSFGDYLCFLDSDDVMLQGRIQQQFNAAKFYRNSIIGCRFHRLPECSTERFTNWANTLSQKQLQSQMYTSHGPTVIMPTWFCSREVYENVGGFSENGKGTPEDLIFFYKHLDVGGSVHRVDECLLMYRYHPDATTFSIKEETIWNLRVARLQEKVLSKWDSFSIWNAGKQGRRFYRSLNPENQKKVRMFCDVDDKKIVKGIYRFEGSPASYKCKILRASGTLIGHNITSAFATLFQNGAAHECLPKRILMGQMLYQLLDAIQGNHGQRKIEARSSNCTLYSAEATCDYMHETRSYLRKF